MAEVKKSIKINNKDTGYFITDTQKVYSSKSKKYLKQRELNGYMVVSIHFGNKNKVLTISRLMAQYFSEQEKGKDQNIVNHIDGNKFNNDINNLEWTTQKQNVNHALENGLTKPHSEKVIQYDKTGKQLKIWDSITEAAESIKLSRHSISKVCNGVNKTAGGFLWKYERNIEKYTNAKGMEVIEDFDYLVDKKGNIYSERNKRKLAPMLTKNGYNYVTLCKDNEKYNFYVHRLVAQAFLPNPDNKPVVNHKNEIKDDNRLENLEWATHSENIKHHYEFIASNPKE